MSLIFERRPNYFQILFLCLAMAPTGLALRYIINRVNVGSDENLFESTATQLYISARIPAFQEEKQRSRFFPFKRRIMDWIQVGDLIKKIEGEPVETYEDLIQVLEKFPNKNRVKVEILRPSATDTTISFHIAKDILSSGALWEIPHSVYVLDAYRGGASERAGMKKGDLILSINGQGFKDKYAADRLVNATTRGQTVDYDILRRGRNLTLKVTMARIHLPITLVLYLLTCLAWMVTGVGLAMLRAHLIAARLVGSGLFFVGVALILFYSHRNMPDLFSNLRLWVSLVSYFFGLAALLHSTYYFPLERPELLSTPWLRYTSYPLGVLGVLLGLALYDSGVVIGTVVVSVPHFFIRYRFRKGKTREHRKLELVLIEAAYATFGLVLFWGLFRSRLSDTHELIVLLVPGIAILLSYWFTIARFRLLGIQIRRSIQYSFISISWLLFCVSFYLFGLIRLAGTRIPYINVHFSLRGIEFYDEALEPAQHLQNEKFLLMLLALVLAFAVYKLNRSVQESLRKKFYRTSYDFNKASHDLSELLIGNLNMTSLGKGLVRKLTKLMMLKRVGLVFFCDESEVCVAEAYGFNSDRWIQFMRSRGPILAGTMKKFKTELRIDYLSPGIKEHLIRDGFLYAYPIFSKEQLAGCLFVGEKLSEATYRHEDFTFLAATARQTSVGIENATLYEKLAGQERLKHELALANQIQTSSLPQSEPEIKGLDISGTSIPALEVGGDYYSYFPINDHELMVMLGDVSGKGTSAALYMSKIQGIFSALHGYGLSPKNLFIKANRILHREMDKQSFATALCAHFNTDQQTIILARTGHIPLLCFRKATLSVEKYAPKGLALGIDNKGIFDKLLEEQVVPYQVGDVFLFISDGISEALSPDQKIFGEERLLDLLKIHAHLNARGIRDLILQVLSSFAKDAEQHDDQTLVVVKIV